MSLLSPSPGVAFCVRCGAPDPLIDRFAYACGSCGLFADFDSASAWFAA